MEIRAYPDATSKKVIVGPDGEAWSGEICGRCLAEPFVREVTEYGRDANAVVVRLGAACLREWWPVRDRGRLFMEEIRRQMNAARSGPVYGSTYQDETERFRAAWAAVGMDTDFEVFVGDGFRIRYKKDSADRAAREAARRRKERERDAKRDADLEERLRKVMGRRRRGE